MAKQKVYNYKKEMIKSAVIIITGIYLLIWAYTMCSPYLFAKEKRSVVAHITNIQDLKLEDSVFEVTQITWQIRKDESGFDKDFIREIETKDKGKYNIGDTKQFKIYLNENNEYEIFEFEFSIISKLILGISFISVCGFDVVYRTKQEKAKRLANDSSSEEEPKEKDE